MERVTLGDNEIESLINGGSIQKELSDGTIVSISQSIAKDVAAPIINHDKKIYSDAEIKNIKISSLVMADILRSGY